MKHPRPHILRDLELRNNNISPAKESRLLAVDYGEKFCGFAFSPDGICVFPLSIVATKNLEKELRDTLNKKSVQKMIWGLPLQPDGGENKICAQIRLFVEELHSPIPVEFINERFSSKFVSAPQEENRQDDLAAAKILEFYLSKI